VCVLSIVLACVVDNGFRGKRRVSAMMLSSGTQFTEGSTKNEMLTNVGKR